MQQLCKLRSGLLALTVVLALSASAVADPQPEPRSVSEEDARWLLGNAEVIFKLNIKQMIGSELMKKGGLDMLKGAIAANAQAKALLDAAGLDVTRDVDSILASGAAGTGGGKDVKVRVVIKGRFEPAKIATALEKRDEVKVSKEGAVQLFELSTPDQSLFAAFANRNTLVLTQARESTLNVVKNGGKKPSAISPEMSKALTRFTGKESMTLALVMTDDAKNALRNVPEVGESAAKLQAVTAAITFTDQVAVNITGSTGDPKAAGVLAKYLDRLKSTAKKTAEDLPKPVQEILDSVTVTSDRDSVKIDLKVSKDTIDRATKGG